MDIRRCPLRDWVLKDPHAVAIICDGKQLTRAQLDNQVEFIRQSLAAQGVNAEDRIVVPVRKTIDAILLIIACLRSQWVFCPINTRMPESQLQQYCQSIMAGWIVGQSMDGMTKIEWPMLPASCDVIPVQPLPLSPDCLCDLIATSGTTGVPKAVCHSYSNHWYSAKGAETLVLLKLDDQWLLSLPLFHVGGYGIVIRCLLAGATMVINNGSQSLGQFLVASRITHLSLVNTQLHRLLSVERCDLTQTHLKTILLGGGFASRGLVEEANAAGVDVLTTYGMTEMSSQVCTGKPLFVHSGVTSGHCLPYRKIKVSDSGEILVKGETLSSGYYSHGNITTLVDESGWYHTGDKGYWVENEIKVTGRIDNMLISGGENIHPEEVEQALLGLDTIVQAVVVAVDDDDYGQRPWAFVETVSDGFNEVFTKQQLEGSIARFKIPDVIRLFPDSMKSTGLKPNRHLLQKLAQNEAKSAISKSVY